MLEEGGIELNARFWPTWPPPMVRFRGVVEKASGAAGYIQSGH